VPVLEAESSGLDHRPRRARIEWAARALMDNTELPARKIAEEAMKVAGKICIFTNENFTIEELSSVEEKTPA